MTNFDCNILDKYKKYNTNMFTCQYCGKVCKNLNSLRQHEIRCKMNSNRIVNSGNKGKLKDISQYLKMIKKNMYLLQF